MDSEVLIVGAGPVGLTMAAALHERGLTCRIIDKAPAPSDKSKALVVWSRTLELLDNLGLATTFINAGMKALGARIYGNGKLLVHVTLNDVESPFAFPLMIPQSETERLLTEHLAERGIAVERQVELISFTEGPNAVISALRHADGREESFSTPRLIGCDGAHSAVRHVLGIPFTGCAEPNDWLLADVHVTGPLASAELSIYWHEQGVLVFFPITANRFRVIADLGTAAASPPPTPTLADVQAKVDERGPGGLTITDPVWLAGFRINERKVSEYRRGRVFLAGDAAHIHSPAGGQGMNTGMQDAFNLTWKLVLVERGVAHEQSLLDSYSIERSAVGDQVLHGAAMLTMLATLRNPVAQYARNHAAPLIASFGFVQDKIKNNLCELSINYRHSPLSAQDWPALSGGAHAGDRLPAAPLLNPATHEHTTLFDAIRGTRHTLLLLPGSHDPELTRELVNIAHQTQQRYPEMLFSHLILASGDRTKPPETSAVEPYIPVWLDPDGHLHQKLGAVDPTLILVRPDGYIGYRGQPADGEALSKYLDRYLIPTHKRQS
jgi:2-polyprenyl-6-methoxyphenol hydroxylase-like FAD-dependent oxidoreductase